MRLVEELLPAKDLKRLNRRIQEENIRQGSIEQSSPVLFYVLLLF